jgi:hypothetical protein
LEQEILFQLPAPKDTTRRQENLVSYAGLDTADFRGYNIHHTSASYDSFITGTASGCLATVLRREGTALRCIAFLLLAVRDLASTTRALIEV